MCNVIKPKRLTENSLIGVFTPSEPITSERESRVQAGIKYLQSKGYRITTGDNYLKNFFYMGGTTDERLQDINRLLNRNDVDALMTSWGGKSCNQLISQLNYDLIREKRKIIIGFSDSTCLLNAVFAKTGLITFLGPNVVGKLDESEYSDLTFLKHPSENSILLSKQDIAYVINPGRSTGRLIGGTLNSFILGVLNTEYEPTLRGSIFLLETGSRTPQELDQLLTYMVNSKKTAGIGGIVICNYDKCVDSRNWGGRSAEEIFREKFSSLNIPIIHTPIFGHGKLTNPIFPIGALCSLDTTESILKIEEPIVE